MSIRASVVCILIGFSLMVSHGCAARRNKVLGTWRMVSAQLDRNGESQPAYGKKPIGLLSFTSDMHYVEVLTDGDIAHFKSNVRGQGTDDENRAVMATDIGMFGAYSVDENGDFAGDRVEGSTFPNWVGDLRTRKNLQVIVRGDVMTEVFQRPDGSRITIVWARVH